MSFSDAVITTAGFLAATVGAGTASALGTTIQVALQHPGPYSEKLAEVSKNAPLLLAGVVTYFFVGVVVLVVWLLRAEVAPDVVKTFSLGVLGWAGGAFASVFKPQPK